MFAVNNFFNSKVYQAFKFIGCGSFYIITGLFIGGLCIVGLIACGIFISSLIIRVFPESIGRLDPLTLLIISICSISLISFFYILGKSVIEYAASKYKSMRVRKLKKNIKIRG